MNYKHLDQLQRSFAMKRSAIRKRLREYRAVPVEGYFYELLYCIMTPQSSAVNAAKAQRNFEANDFLNNDIDPEPLLHQPDYYIRFHRSKAKWITEMKKNFVDIVKVTTGPLLASEKREWFVKNVKGLSYKEATHFLRNIGKNEGLAILDRHILKNLKLHGVIHVIPVSLSRKRYLLIERKFLSFALHLGISVDELDLLFWSNEAGEILK
ncbi:MAG: DNA lyase [Bacteroidetes bacterium]|nr:DNA lyase [Bacteroidota bacterium]